MGFENGILMVTEDTQKLCCDREVFWGQLTPLSGAAKQAGCSRRKEKQLERVIEVSSGQIFSTFAKSCRAVFRRLFMTSQNHFLVFSSFLPCERNINVEGAWHELFLYIFLSGRKMETVSDNMSLFM